jgi:hypothetical protein
MRDKKKTKNVKVRDLKPKKDARGGAVANTNQTRNPFNAGTHAGTNAGTHAGTNAGTHAGT